jgi:hypothetical protein
LPLFADGLKKIRTNLIKVQAGERPKLVKVGILSPGQLEIINKRRSERGWEPIGPTVVFLGKHMYDSRCTKDGYSIDELLVQIESAFSDGSTVLCERASAALRNPVARDDGRGHHVHDEAVFECTARYPSAELYSVAPKGDGKAPHQKSKGPSKRSLS